ncbi:MAG: hypothetical protein PHG00_00040 [Methylococcales bacterium]|nr:hypothetical protein [Methylococcales bacterium]
MPFAAQIQVLSTPVQHLLNRGNNHSAIVIWLSLSILAIAWTSAQAEALSGGGPGDICASSRI